jgi:transposase-like protein
MEIRDALLQIRDVLAYVAMPPAPTASTACTHPDDQRVNLSSMGETRWKCKTCKYEHSEPRLAAAPT